MIQVEKGNLQKGIESLNKALELIKVEWLKRTRNKKSRTPLYKALCL